MNRTTITYCSTATTLSRIRAIAILLPIFLLFACGEDPQREPEPSAPRQLDPILEDYEPPLLKKGFLDANLEIVVEPKFDEIRAFSEGKAAVSVNGWWGYIDPSGNWIVEPKYLGAWSFDDGIARVQSAENRKMGMIDQKGDTAIQLIYDEVSDFEYGRSRTRMGNYFGLIDSAGKWVLPARYDNIRVLSSRYSSLQTSEGWKIYDHVKDQSLDPSFHKVYEQTGDIFRVQFGEGEFGYTSFQGAMTHPDEKYDHAYAPQEGRFVVAERSNQYYILDPQGSKVAGPYPQIRPMGEERFAYLQSGRWGLMDDQGQTILPPQFEQIYSFSERRAPFQKESLWGYINADGEVMCPNTFGLAYPYRNGYARVLTREGFGLLDLSCQLRLPPAGIGEIYNFQEGRMGCKELPTPSE